MVVKSQPSLHTVWTTPEAGNAATVGKGVLVGFSVGVAGAGVEVASGVAVAVGLGVSVSVGMGVDMSGIGVSLAGGGNGVAEAMGVTGAVAQPVKISKASNAGIHPSCIIRESLCMSAPIIHVSCIAI